MICLAWSAWCVEMIILVRGKLTVLISDRPTRRNHLHNLSRYPKKVQLSRSPKCQKLPFARMPGLCLNRIFPVWKKCAPDVVWSHFHRRLLVSVSIP